jgi:hypothetical protein
LIPEPLKEADVLFRYILRGDGFALAAVLALVAV